jgi:hypothetical protein
LLKINRLFLIMDAKFNMNQKKSIEFVQENGVLLDIQSCKKLKFFLASSLHHYL